MSGKFRRALVARGPSQLEPVDAVLEARAAALLEIQRGRKQIQPPPNTGRHAGPILKPLLDKSGMGLIELKRRWEEIVGEKLAASTEPEKISGGVLTIKAPAAIAPFVQHQQTLILERCRLAGAKVKSLAIKQGAAPSRTAANVRPLARPLAAHEEAALESALSSIDAPQLKAALARLGRAVRRS